ncbi:MAG: RHS repeat protein [Phycisphaerales bacterium]|nr:RHS repeat protein [Phycisphaerales bacterium]
MIRFAGGPAHGRLEDATITTGHDDSGPEWSISRTTSVIEYNANHQPLTITGSDGKTVLYTYDELGRVKTITRDSGVGSSQADLDCEYFWFIRDFRGTLSGRGTAKRPESRHSAVRSMTWLGRPVPVAQTLQQGALLRPKTP